MTQALPEKREPMHFYREIREGVSVVERSIQRYILFAMSNQLIKEVHIDAKNALPVSSGQVPDRTLRWRIHPPCIVKL